MSLLTAVTASCVEAPDPTVTTEATPVISTNWTSIGPRGGFFKRFAGHPTNPDIVFAGSDDCGGVFRTSNAGVNWQLVSEEIKNMTADGLAIDPVDPLRVYASDITGRNRVIRSTDGGINWASASSGLPVGVAVGDIAVDPTNNSRLFVGTGDLDTPGSGVYRSETFGQSWLPSGLSWLEVEEIEVASNGYVYAGTQNGVWRSTDHGLNWTRKLQLGTLVTALAVDPASGAIWAGTVTTGTTPSIYVSIDDGNTFAPAGLPGEWITDILPGPATLATTLGSGLKVTSNGGLQWTDSGSQLVAQNPFTLALGLSATGVTFAGKYSNEGIFRSLNGGASWNNTNVGVHAYECKGMAVAPTNPYRIYVAGAAGYTAGNSDRRSARGTIDPATDVVTWAYLDGIPGHATSVAVRPTNADHILVGTFENGLRMSTDSGATAAATMGLGTNHFSALSVVWDRRLTNVAVASTIDYLDAAGAPNPAPVKRVYRSVNSGGFFSSKVVTWVASAMLSETGPNNWMFAATDTGVWRSNDNGDTWTATDLQVPLLAIVQDPQNKNLLFAGAESGNLYRSTNRGANWTAISHPVWPLGAEIRALATDPTISNVLYVSLNGAERREPSGTSVKAGGIWVSTNANAPTVTFTSLDTPALHNNMIWGLATAQQPNAGVLYACTYDSGVFRIKLY